MSGNLPNEGGKPPVSADDQSARRSQLERLMSAEREVLHLQAVMNAQSPQKVRRSSATLNQALPPDSDAKS